MGDIGQLLIRLGVNNAPLKAGFAEARLASMQFADTALLATRASTSMSGALNSAGFAAKSESSIAQTLGGSIGGIISPTTLAAGGALALAGALGDSVKAAIDEQAAVAQLAASLNANVPAWGGNVAAIETYIGAAEKASGFSRDVLTTSLEKLVGATHNVAAAENVLGIATNLARYKGMDLVSATSLLVDVEAGRFRGLVQLGIATHAHETAMEALNAVNRIAAGQDTSYLGTAAGQMAVLDNNIHDLTVELGQKLLPVFAQVLSVINNNLIPAVGFLADAWDKALNILTAGGSHALAAWTDQQAAASAAAAAATTAAATLATIQDDRESASLSAASAYWDRMNTAQVMAQQAATAAAIPFYADARQRQMAANDAMASSADMASKAAQAQQMAAFIAETKIAGSAALAAVGAANKAGMDAAIAYGTGLRSGQNAVTSGLKQMLSDMKSVLSVPKQIAALEGELASKALASALRDGRPQVRTDAIGNVQAVMDQLTSLGVHAAQLSKPAAAALALAMKDAKNPTLTAVEQVQAAVQTGLTANYYSFGYKTAQTYVAGITDALKGLPSAVDTSLQALVRKLKAESPPGAESPLHMIDVWGARTGQAWMSGFAGAIGGTSGALGGTSGALGGISGALGGIGASVPGSLPLPTSSPAEFGGASGSSGKSTAPVVHQTNIRLEVDGRVLAEIIDRHLFGSASGFNSGFQAPAGVTGA